tara:strand:+ start:1222 stop:1425 length:204 start_codon:yes stop_codon:yes gene_type:complete
MEKAGGKIMIYNSQILKSHFSIVYKKVFGFFPDMHLEWSDERIIKSTNKILGLLSSTEEKELLGRYK